VAHLISSVDEQRGFVKFINTHSIYTQANVVFFPPIQYIYDRVISQWKLVDVVAFLYNIEISHNFNILNHLTDKFLKNNHNVFKSRSNIRSAIVSIWNENSVPNDILNAIEIEYEIVCEQLLNKTHKFSDDALFTATNLQSVLLRDALILQTSMNQSTIHQYSQALIIMAQSQIERVCALENDKNGMCCVELFVLYLLPFVNIVAAWIYYNS
jgi:hypothetical protein